MTHSPLPRSSSNSPIEYSDPHSSTLLQLLKNISEEVEDQNPNDNATSSGCKSPLASLNSKLQVLASSRSTSPSVQRGPMGNLITIKAKSTSPPKATKEVVTKKSASLEEFNDSSKAVDSKKQGKPLTGSGSEQMMPLIQITSTESQEKKKFTAETSTTNIMMQGTVVDFL